MLEPRYLGDAVYVQEDNLGRLVLTTDCHTIRAAGNKIYLEPEVISALENYIQDYYDQQEELEDSEPRDMTDVEADSDTLKSAGMGTDEDYGYYGDSEES
jgi:hypothetical protein